MTEQILKPVVMKKNEKILKTLVTLKNNGMKETSVTHIGYCLDRLNADIDIENPDAVKGYIADMHDKKTQKPLNNATKNKYVFAYDHYVKLNGLTWQRPIYKIPEKAPLIPTRQNVQAIIDNSSKNYATIFTIMAEIGACPEEMHLVNQKDIDREKGTIAITGVKKHGSKTYTLKKHTATMLNDYLGRHTKEHPFPQAHVMSQMFLQYKKRASEKLCKPDIMKIELRNLRNFAGEQFYKSLPIRDAWAVMHYFRHKKMETTQHYLQAMECTFEEDDEYISLVIHSVEEECKAVEKGYTLVRAIDPTTAIYRKRKC